jgi:signal transduction histidine kinase
VAIHLGEVDGSVSFSVEDDGAGFDPSAVEYGAGLTNLADRVAAVGGTLEIEARPGGGTRVRGEIPIRS